MDQYALQQVFEINHTVKEYYDNYEFFRGFPFDLLIVVAQTLQMYTAVSLSRHYLSETKDILYCDAPNSPRRRGVQYVLSQILLNYLSMISPLIPLYAEEAWNYTPAVLKREDAVYKMGWFSPPAEWSREDLASDMANLEPLKEQVLGILEQARQEQYVTFKCD